MLDRTRRSIIGAGIVGGTALIGGLSGCRDMIENLAAGSTQKEAGQASLALADYEMPPETAPHERTLMQWPVSLEVYGRKSLQAVQSRIALIANTISRFEPVAMMVSDADANAARSQLDDSVAIWNIPTDDLWCRDSGPTFVKNAAGALAVSHIRFNGWGNKQLHDNDGNIAKRVAARLGLPLLDSGLVGEGGGVEHDGAGTLLATASCWVNSNRNRGTQTDIGRKLTCALGGEKIIWVPGLKGKDITDYHIDALARFVNPGKILIQLPARIDPADPFSRAAFEAYDILKRQTDAQGRKFEIITIPEPVNIRSRKADFLASYVNYYVCNRAVIAPEFGDDRIDQKAQDTLKRLYPQREIVMLNIDPLGEAGGGIHCATQQQPKRGNA